MVEPVPAVPFLEWQGGKPFLRGSRCGHCDAVYAGGRAVCGACGTRNQMASITLAEIGKLYSYTIVYRSFPGVQTPFIAAVVDLDGGGSLKGTLRDIPLDASAIPFDLCVRVVIADSGQTSASGAPFLSYHFTPTEVA